jgi:hypothetical protein
MSKSLKEYSEAFEIFAKYGEGRFNTYAEHDIIYAGPDPAIVSDEDKKRLSELGWFIGEDTQNCFSCFT